MTRVAISVRLASPTTTLEDSHEQCEHTGARSAAGAGQLRGAADRPRRFRLRRGSQPLQRHVRQAARADRSLRERRRRDKGRGVRACARPADRHPGRRTQRRRPGLGRRRRGDRPLADARRRGRSRRAHRPRRRRLHLGRGGRRDQRARARHPERDHLDHRCGRPHARRRPRPPHPQVRTRDRQPARGRGGARERRAGPGQRGREPRPVLGAQRRRRELRRRDLVPVPAARCRARSSPGPTFWPVGERRRGPEGLPRLPAERAAGAERLLPVRVRSARPAVPGGAPPAQGLRRRVVLRGRGRGGSRRGDGATAGRPARAAAARAGSDATPRDSGRIRRGLPGRRPVVLACRLREGHPGRGDRDPREVRRRDADVEVHHAPVPDRRRRP